MKLTIISDKGSPMMVVTDVRRKNDDLEVAGQLMGAWPSKMYITPEEFWCCIRIAVSLPVLKYALAYPRILLKVFLKTRKSNP